MKKGEIYEGTAEYIEFPNRAVVRAEECADGGDNQAGFADANGGADQTGCEKKPKVIVKNCVPGQKVRFVINKKRGEKCEGRLLEVIEKSPFETESYNSGSVCGYFGKCGGCVYQSMDYSEQLKMKETQVKNILSEVIKGDFGFEGIIGSPLKEGYRNKMEFTFGDEVKGGELALGLHRRNSMYDIVTVDGCKIVDDDFSRILNCVCGYFKEKKLPYFHKMTHEGYLRHLLVRKAAKTGQILVDIVTTTQMQFDMSELSKKLENLELKGKIVGFLHTFNDSIADVVKNEGTEVIFGQDFIQEELLGLKFNISAFSFFQTNSLGAEVLYSKAREYVGTTKDKVVFDLYSGTGTIAQILAPVAKKVIGVEIVGEAVSAARENAELNGLSNCEFIADDVLKALDNISSKPDLIVLDPPRDGIHPKALEKIIGYGVEHMVYISCKPTSLARDLVTLQERGYRVEKSCCVDMFPGTVHVETVVLLSKGEIDSKKVRVEFSLEDMDMSGFQKDATYGQIKERVLQQTGLKVSSLYIAQVKQKYGIIERENYNKSKSENARQPKCPPEKEAAITEALKFFGMI